MQQTIWSCCIRTVVRVAHTHVISLIKSVIKRNTWPSMTSTYFIAAWIFYSQIMHTVFSGCFCVWLWLNIVVAGLFFHHHHHHIKYIFFIRLLFGGDLCGNCLLLLPLLCCCICYLYTIIYVRCPPPLLLLPPVRRSLVRIVCLRWWALPPQRTHNSTGGDGPLWSLTCQVLNTYFLSSQEWCKISKKRSKKKPPK